MLLLSRGYTYLLQHSCCILTFVLPFSLTRRKWYVVVTWRTKTSHRVDSAYTRPKIYTCYTADTRSIFFRYPLARWMYSRTFNTRRTFLSVRVVLFVCAFPTFPDFFAKLLLVLSDVFGENLNDQAPNLCKFQWRICYVSELFTYNFVTRTTLTLHARYADGKFYAKSKWRQMFGSTASLRGAVETNILLARGAW